MNWDAIGAIGEIIGALAVVGSLAYLAIQIRQNNASVKSAAAQAILTNINTGLQTISQTPEMSRVPYMGLADFESLQQEEKWQFTTWIYAWVRVMEQAYYSYKRGDLDEVLFDGHSLHLRGVFESETVKVWWIQRRNVFSKEFQDYIDEITSVPSVAVPTAHLADKIASEAAT